MPLAVREQQEQCCSVMDTETGAVRYWPEVQAHGTETRKAPGRPRAQTTGRVHSMEAGPRSSWEGQSPGWGPNWRGMRPDMGSAVTWLRRGAATSA